MSESAAALAEINGVRFGRLTALRFVRFAAGRKVRLWEFRCTCGGIRTYPLFKVRNGDIKSCGCDQNEEVERIFSLTDLTEYRKQHGKFHLLPMAMRLDLIRTEYKNRGIYNHACTPFDLWLSDPECPFLRRHVRVVERARDLWRSIERPTNYVVTPYGVDGAIPERAKNLLRRCKAIVPRWEWNVFENVVRWNEPYGVSGSRLMSSQRGADEAALATVLRVAETISRSLII
jgi:hypothetical protein